MESSKESNSEGKASSANAETEEGLQERAKTMYEAGKLGECLLVLEAAEAHGQKDARQKLVVQMHIAARNREWWKVMAIPFKWRAALICEICNI